MARQTRLGRLCLRRLDAGVEASGPHDFTVRSNISRQRAVRSLTDLSTRPAITSRAYALLRPPHPVPTSVTIAKRPSMGRYGGGYRSDLGQAGTRIFFQTGLDRANQIDPVQQIVVPAHRQGGPQSVIPEAANGA